MLWGFLSLPPDNWDCMEVATLTYLWNTMSAADLNFSPHACIFPLCVVPSSYILSLLFCLILFKAGYCYANYCSIAVAELLLFSPWLLLLTIIYLLPRFPRLTSSSWFFYFSFWSTRFINSPCFSTDRPWDAFCQYIYIVLIQHSFVGS